MGIICDIIKHVQYGSIKKKYGEDEINLYQLCFAVAVFMDGTVKEIEIAGADAMITKFVQKRYPLSPSRDLRILKECLHDGLIQSLTGFRKDKEHYRRAYIKIKRYLKTRHNREMFGYMINIIKADNIVSAQERAFLEEIQASMDEEESLRGIERPGFRSGISMIEIVLAIVTISVASYYYIQELGNRNYKDAIEEMKSDIAALVVKGTMDSTVGYANGTGGDCSNAYHFGGLSAGRVVDCTGWSNFAYGGVKSTNGAESFITGLMRQYTSDHEGCSLFLAQGATVNQLHVFLDCSNLWIRDAETSGRQRHRIEEHFVSLFQHSADLKPYVEAVAPNALSVALDAGGTNNDGMVRVTITN